jgi:hypothetical protein
VTPGTVAMWSRLAIARCRAAATRAARGQRFELDRPWSGSWDEELMPKEAKVT